MGCVETNRQSSNFLLTQCSTRLNDSLQIPNNVQYPLKLKAFGALRSPFFTIGNWLLTLWLPYSQWCVDRNVNRIVPEYNQSTQKSYIIWDLICLLVSPCIAMCKLKSESQYKIYFIHIPSLSQLYFVTCQFMCSFWSNPRTEWPLPSKTCVYCLFCLFLPK